MSDDIKVGDHVEWDSRYNTTILHHITPHHTTPHHTKHNKTHHTTPHHTTPHHTTPHHTTPTTTHITINMVGRQGHSVGVVEKKLTHDKKVINFFYNNLFLPLYNI